MQELNYDFQEDKAGADSLVSFPALGKALTGKQILEKTRNGITTWEKKKYAFPVQRTKTGSFPRFLKLMTIVLNDLQTKNSLTLAGIIAPGHETFQEF